MMKANRSRPLLSKSGCIYSRKKVNMKKYTKVLVPFYRGAVVFSAIEFMDKLLEVVLVPFYRGAVVFRRNGEII